MSKKKKIKNKFNIQVSKVAAYEKYKKEKKYQERLEKKYQTYLKAFEREQNKMRRLGLKIIRETADTKLEFQNAMDVAKMNGKLFTSTSYVREQSNPRTDKQNEVLLEFATITNDDGSKSFTWDAADLLEDYDLIDKYAEWDENKHNYVIKKNYKSAHSNELYLTSMIQELGRVMKATGLEGSEIQEAIAEAFYGS